MARDKVTEPEQEAGAPEWMVTFSDCMTLLLTFFVLLLSFSSFTEGKLGELGDAFGNAMPGVINISSVDRNSMVHRARRQRVDGKASNTPTQIEKPTNNMMRETDPKNFRNLKFFSVPSNQIFLGNGKAMSADGKKILSTMAEFLKKMPTRVVISETNYGRADKDKILLNYTRAWMVMNYLQKQGVPAELLNITTSNMLNSNTRLSSTGRHLQITLLDRSIYEP